MCEFILKYIYLHVYIYTCFAHINSDDVRIDAILLFRKYIGATDILILQNIQCFNHTIYLPRISFETLVTHILGTLAGYIVRTVQYIFCVHSGGTYAVY